MTAGPDRLPNRGDGTIEYRFLDAMGDVVDQGEHEDHAAACAWARGPDLDAEVHRVEYRGPAGDWRWAGPLLD